MNNYLTVFWLLLYPHAKSEFQVASNICTLRYMKNTKVMYGESRQWRSRGAALRWQAPKEYFLWNVGIYTTTRASLCSQTITFALVFLVFSLEYVVSEIWNMGIYVVPLYWLLKFSNYHPTKTIWDLPYVLQIRITSRHKGIAYIWEFSRFHIKKNRNFLLY